jgi:hypothetical protein
MSIDDLNLALDHYIQYTKYVRENPETLKEEMRQATAAEIVIET